MIIAERLSAQLLAGPPARDPVEVAGRLLAIHAQDLRGLRLAIRARTAAASGSALDRALSVERSLVVSWLNRGTLHLVRAEDYPWLHALTTPRLAAGTARRLAEEGVTPHMATRGVREIERSLASEGPLTRRQLGERLAAAGVPTAGQALVHLLALASREGLIVRGPMLGGGHAFVLVRDWLGEPPRANREPALAELARRYLGGHGPADPADLAHWAGLALRDARTAFSAIASELKQRDDGLVDLVGRAPAAALPPPRLLGPYEPVLLGWRSRAPFVGTHERDIVRGGVVRPVALVGGEVAGTWGQSGGVITLRPFHPWSAENARALEVDGQDVLEYLAQGQD